MTSSTIPALLSRARWRLAAWRTRPDVIGRRRCSAWLDGVTLTEPPAVGDVDGISAAEHGSGLDTRSGGDLLLRLGERGRLGH